MEIKGTFCFDPLDGIYADHFPGNPVVPGSLIVHAFLKAVKTHGIIPGRCRLENFRFKEFVPPGEYPFSIEKQADRLKCRLFKPHSDGLKTVVTGTVKP